MIKPKQIEEPFGRSESVGSFRKTRHRGRDLVEWFFILSAIPYDLIRITTIWQLEDASARSAERLHVEQILGRYMVEDVIRIPSLSFASIQTLGIPAADDCFLSILLEPQSRKGEKPLSKPKVRCFADPRYGAGSAPPLQAPSGAAPAAEIDRSQDRRR
jgi:hypothetical protein